MIDSKGNKISIGDRVKVLWNFENRIIKGEITKINEKFVEIDFDKRRISINDHSKLTKIL